MTDEIRVPTATDTEDSPPEKSDSVSPEEPGQEEATAEAEVGTEEAEEAVEEKKPDPLHTDPRFTEVIEAKNEAIARAARAEAELDLRRQQERAAETPPPVTVESLKAQYDLGEIEHEEYVERRAVISAEAAVKEQFTVAEQQRSKQEILNRVHTLLPDLKDEGSETFRTFNRIANEEYGYLFGGDGNPVDFRLYETIARDVKKAQDASTRTTNARSAEEQRREAIKGQNINQSAPDGKGVDTTEEHDLMSQLNDDQKEYLRRRGQLNDQGIKDYLRGKKMADTKKSGGDFPSTPWPEKARRRA